MRIKSIQIREFKAFDEAQTLVLGNAGKNLLLYGENGSGKTSVYIALKALLDSSRGTVNFAEYKHHWSKGKSNDGCVIIRLTNGTEYIWAENAGLSTTSGVPLLSDAAKVAGFLDYKSLLRTYFLTPHNGRVNLFSLLIDSVLAERINDLSLIPFRKEWIQIQQAIPSRSSPNKVEAINTTLSSFNNGLQAKLQSLKAKAQEILNEFDKHVEFDFEFAGVGYDPSKKTFNGCEVWLKTKFYGQEIELHQQFLNEARLTAIAISIYFAALLLEPAGDLKLMVLDDVLLGLDLAHRLPLVNVLETYFPNHQLFLLTYDKIWFEVIRKQTQDQGWKAIELHTMKLKDREIPKIRDYKPLLEASRDHLKSGDSKAAAVYARSAFEELMQGFCAKKKIEMPFTVYPDMPKLDTFWKKVQKWSKKYTPPKLNAGLIADIDRCGFLVLNPLSHNQLVTIASKEVADAIDALEILDQELQNL